MRCTLALATAAVAALLVATPASATTALDFAMGFGTRADEWYAAGAVSGPQGQHPSGLAIVHKTAISDAGPVTRTFHGDVSRGCLIVTGNRAIVLGRIPEDEQITFAPIGTVVYAGLFIVDNGRPRAGSPVDLVFADLLNESFGALACSGVFAPAPFLLPLERGDFAVHDA
jgi:hypothetical protein